MEKEAPLTKAIPQPIRLDQGEIEASASALPEPMREKYVWLAMTLRDECNRDLDVLVERFKAVKVYIDKTTWSKIFRGRYNRDAQGTATAPILSVDKFCSAVESLRSNVDLIEVSGKMPFIETLVYRDVENYILPRMQPECINKFGMIVGHTGSQKTATLKEFERRHRYNIKKQMHRAVVRIEAAEAPSLALVQEDMVYKLGGARNLSTRRRRNKITELARGRCFLFENVQDLMVEGEYNQKIFSYWRKLQEDTDCTVIFTITPKGAKSLEEGISAGYFEQFIGRAGGRHRILVLPTHAPDQDVLTIVKAFGVVDAEENFDFFKAISEEHGRIRVLFGDLQMAKALAEATKRPLTVEVVKEARATK